MVYCPKCKTEYEDHAHMCADCEVELVPNLEEYTYMKDLIRVKSNDSEELLKYLDYSGISKVETIEEGDTLLIKVAQEDYEKAVTYLKVYIHEHMEEEDEEDYYFDEYSSEEIDVDATVSDMNSTVLTFGVVGVGILVLTALNYLDIVSLRGFNKNMITIVFGLLGATFVAIAIHTNKKIDDAKEKGSSKESILADMVIAYKEKYSMTSFYKDHRIKTKDVDEGALYFLVFDVLKKEVKKMYPEAEDVMINTVVERLYDEIEE